jgi:DNA (cytosine-5)-methyltransferase 1
MSGLDGLGWPTNDDREQTGGDCVSRLVVHLDLFSGIGGFALAAQMVGGIKTVAFCEINSWARGVLSKNFPGVPIHADVKTLNPNTYGRIDLITGGWPCQPHSSAGKRKGTADDRYLWSEMYRVIKACRPTWFLGENVAGIISVELDQVLSDLEIAGYAATAFSVPAVACDAPHGRPRWWVVGHANGTPENTYPAPGPSDTRGQATSEPSRWPSDAGMGRTSDGVSNRMDTHRLTGLGNAIVPQVAAEIIRGMMRADHSLLNDERIHGGAGAGKPRETSSPSDGASC